MVVAHDDADGFFPNGGPEDKTGIDKGRRNAALYWSIQSV
jgi:hypothetical protein